MPPTIPPPIASARSVEDDVPPEEDEDGEGDVVEIVAVETVEAEELEVGCVAPEVDSVWSEREVRVSTTIHTV